MRTLLFFLLLFSGYASFGQDLIIKTSGEQIKARIIRVTDNEVRYAKTDSAFSLPNTEVFLIKYADGEEKVITPKPSAKKKPLTLAQKITQDSLNIAGRRDAEKYYKGSSGASAITVITTAILPPVGLLTAIGAGTAAPDQHNLNYPNDRLFENPAYAQGYRHRAKKMKQQRVWASFGAGSAMAFFLYYMVFPKVIKP